MDSSTSSILTIDTPPSQRGNFSRIPTENLRPRGAKGRHTKPHHKEEDITTATTRCHRKDVGSRLIPLATMPSLIAPLGNSDCTHAATSLSTSTTLNGAATHWKAPAVYATNTGGAKHWWPPETEKGCSGSIHENCLELPAHYRRRDHGDRHPASLPSLFNRLLGCPAPLADHRPAPQRTPSISDTRDRARTGRGLTAD